MRRLLPGPVVELDRDGLTAAYAGPDLPPGGAHVRANFVLSADGAVELDGSSRGLSGPADLRILSLLRGLCDVVLVGAATARSEDYGPARPDAARQQWRRDRGLAPVPPIAVVSGRLDLDPAARLFTDAVARPLVVTTEAAAAERGSALAKVADLVIAGRTELSVAAIPGALAERGLGRVLCEGGPALYSQLLAAGLVDEMCLTVSPLVIGGRRGPISPENRPATPRALALLHVLTDDGMIFLRYEVQRPAATAARTRH